jgi:trehalose synthase-fused probable maltokinase
MEEHASSRPLLDRPAGLPTLELGGAWDWDKVLGPAPHRSLEMALARGIATRRWFGSKAKTIQAMSVVDAFSLTNEVRLALVEVRLTAGPAEVYQLPLAFATGEKAQRLLTDAAPGLWSRVQLGDRREPAVLFDALDDEDCSAALLRLFETAATLQGNIGRLVAWQAGSFNQLHGRGTFPLPPKPSQAEQSNSSIIYGDRLILKVFRRVEMGLNPDLELNAYLSQRGFAHVPPLAGALEYRRDGQQPWAFAMLQGFVPNQGDAWKVTLDSLAALLDRVSKLPANSAAAPGWFEHELCDAASRPLASEVETSLGESLSEMDRLGARTAEMHLALAAATDDPAMVPQPFSADDEQVFFEHARQLADDTFQLLADQVAGLPAELARKADQVLRLKGDVEQAIRTAGQRPIHALGIRCHGDYHLGQVLVTGNDFVIIDFEGEPARPLSQRRQRQLALRDVAGMLRSFHYASCSAAAHAKEAAAASDFGRIDDWTSSWCFWTSAAFLRAYRRVAAAAAFLPTDEQEFRALLKLCILEKAIYELRYELNNRPDWVYLPIEALLDIFVPKRSAGRRSNS